ncbi:MAG TPA: iron-containing alcohol dehydrogenase, partial [Chroococcales cyanobacterium]
MQQVLSGLASLQGLPERISAQNVLLLTYGGGARNPGILRLIESWRCNLLHFPFSTALLEGDQVSEVFEVFEGLRFRPDVLVSVGGGAVLDLAKCLKLLFDCPSTVLLSHEERNWQKNTLHVAVPTTAGTGSEATPFATVYQGETKHSVEDPRLIP